MFVLKDKQVPEAGVQNNHNHHHNKILPKETVYFKQRAVFLSHAKAFNEQNLHWCIRFQFSSLGHALC